MCDMCPVVDQWCIINIYIAAQCSALLILWGLKWFQVKPLVVTNQINL